nr:ankyrin repeat-containing protein [Tanacetum cinerariifolium]
MKSVEESRRKSLMHFFFDYCLNILLRWGNRFCRTMINPMPQEVIWKVKFIYFFGVGPNDDNPLIIASRLGLVDMVWGFIKCAKQTNTNLYNGKSGEFQEFLWLRNKLNETALDVAIKQGHVEVAKLLLENASWECLISKRNHEGKLLVSMLADHEHDMFILSILEKARTAAVVQPASTLMWILNQANKYAVITVNYELSICPLSLPAGGGSRGKQITYLEYPNEERPPFDPRPLTWTGIEKSLGRGRRMKNLIACHGYVWEAGTVQKDNWLLAELVDTDPSILYEIIKEGGINTSVVHIAASRGYCETVKVLMTHCPGCSELLDEKGKNIFHVAVENKQTEVIKFIYGDISYTSLVNQKDKDGNTPIHLLMASDLEMMEVAMDYRVNINVMNNEKLTPLDMTSSTEKRKRLLKVHIFMLN